MQACSIEARDLACRRGDRVLFRGLTLAASAGDVVHVTGLNGTGKSSLLRILAGLLPPFSGTVARTGPLGLVDERPALDPALPLGKALAFWRQVDGGRGTDATTLLGLADLLDVPVRYLSTGQKKRAALARLIAQDAAIWLLDEPLNGLDARAVPMIVSLVDAHRAAGGIALIASHQSFDLPGKRMVDLAEFRP
ncbi:MAG: heme ABC exporter ATP-binding protein CcmA [Novosphingobium sp.]|nr:heme ABC exporter ATP-binding protein CcmA [Novosphingobium sp.]